VFQDWHGTCGQEIVWVDWNAVASHTGTRTKGNVAKWLRGRSLADLPGIDTQGDASIRHLVGIGSAYHTLAVLVQFGHLRNLRRRDLEKSRKYAAIELAYSFERRDVKARNNLGYVPESRRNAPGIDSLETVTLDADQKR
jgi:hypothetical protein